MDLVSGARDIEEEEVRQSSSLLFENKIADLMVFQELPPKNWLDRFWRAVA
jgi:hypothetical protein